MDFSQLKLRTLFDPYQLPRRFGQGQQQPMGQEFDPIARLKEIYQPRTDMSDAYANAVTHMPVREEPGMLQKIASVLASAGSSRPTGISHGSPIGFEFNPQVGAAASDEALYPQFSEEMRDWATKIEPLGKAAGMEKDYNTNQRILANEAVTREEQERRLQLDKSKADETERRNKETEKDRAKRTEIAEKRAEIYGLKADKPNLKFFTDKDGMVIGIDDATGEQVTTGVNTGDLSDIDKSRLQLKNDLAKIGAQGEQNRLTKVVVPGKNTNSTEPKPPTPSATNRDLLNRAQQLWNTRPDLQKYLETNNGKPTGNIKAASNGLLGLGAGDKKLEQEARDLLYGKSNNQPKADTLGIR